jgi:lysozyme
VVPFVATHEGTVHRTYRDPIGIVTACTGHTGPELRMGQTFTREQCEAMLYQDLAQHADALGCIRQPLTDGQRAAFLSFAFNVGEGHSAAPPWCARPMPGTWMARAPS